MGLIEPTVVPGLDKALLELLIIFGAIVVAGLVVIISSVVGIFRAARRRRRGVRSVAAVVLAGARLQLQPVGWSTGLAMTSTTTRIRLMLSWRSTWPFVCCLFPG